MRTATCLLLPLFACLTAIPANAQFELLYRETFPVAENYVNRGPEARLQGWEVIGRGQSGDQVFTMIDPGTPLPGSLSYVVTGAGIIPDGDADVAGLNNDPVGPIDSDGILFASRGFAPHLFFTEEVPAGTMSGDIDQLIMNVRNNSPNANQAGSQVMRPALKVGGAWYASDASLIDTDGVFSVQTLNLGDDNWDLVGVTQLDTVGLTSLDGVAFAGAFDQTLPAGEVEAWGVFNENLTGNTRFESIAFASIPEPTAGLLALVGLAGLANGRRRG